MKILQYLYTKLKSKLNKNVSILAVDITNKNIITFKNGSKIEVLESASNCRGKRSELIKIK